jgi:transcription elongation factor S-II
LVVKYCVSQPASHPKMKIETPEIFRKNIQTRFSAILEEDETSIDNQKKSINLEKALFNYAIKESDSKKIVKKWENPQFTQIYVDRARTIYMNLKNEEILKQIIDGEITPQQFVFMTHQEMNTEHWRQFLEDKKQRDATKYTNNIQASTDMFMCRKCKSKKCTYYEMQTRSADEPTSIFVQCLDCGKSWREQ